MKPILEIIDLDLKFGAHLSLKSLNFTVNEHDFMAIMGANGVGKSSLISAILGLIPADLSSCRLYSHPFTHFSAKKRAQLIGFVPQLINIPLNMTVKSWCEMARFPYQKWGFQLSTIDHEKIENALFLTNMQNYANTIMNELSGGERQKALIAGVLAQDTPIIFLDEPLNHLDLKHQAEILQLLTKLNQDASKTIICVMHEMNQVMRYCKQVIGLNRQGILFQGLCAEVMNAENLSQLYQYPIHCLENVQWADADSNLPFFVAG